MTREEVIKDLQDIFHKMDRSDVDLELDVPFFYQGLDSLDVAEFLMEIEMKYGISFDDAIFYKIKSPSDCVELILEAVNQKAQS